MANLAATSAAKSIATKQFRLMAIFASILALLIFNGWFLNYNFNRISEQEKWVSHTAKVLSELDLILLSATEAETGVRGFLLTNQSDHLEMLAQGRRGALEHAANVRALTSNDKLQQVAINSLEETLRQRFEILDGTRKKFSANGNKLLSTDVKYSEGKFVMDAFRNQIATMKQEETSLMAERTKAAEQARLYFFWTLVLTTLLASGVITFAFNQMARNQERMADETEGQRHSAYEKKLVADVAIIVAGDSSVESIGVELLEFMSNSFGVLASKLLTFERGKLLTSASYGVELGDQNSSNGVLNSGLVSTSLNRREPWQVNNVPDSYWKITSSLGSATPTSLTMVPFSFQGRELGIMELATFEKLRPDQISIIGKMTESIGIGISAAQSRAALQNLLERTQQQSEELQAQQEELRTNNEELEQQARALESQQQSLNFKNKELEATQLDLQTKAADLELSSQYKSEFLAKMSHELRTPLNGLMILSTLLIENREKNLTEQQRQFARSINSAGNDLLSLINDILDLSKIEARKLTLRPEAFTLGALMESKKRTFEPQTTAKGLELVTEVSPELANLRMYTDRQRLEQILRNFMSNAIKFTESGKISLEATYDDRSKKVTLTAVDSGIGIPANKQGLIFEAFEQADSSVSRKYGGTGLGLTISRELAQLLGGELLVESTEGVGSRFSVRIPIELKETDHPATADELSVRKLSREESRQDENVVKILNPLGSARVEAQVRDALKNLKPGKKTILVVEDDDKFRSSVVEAIKSYQFDSIEAADGEVALALLNRHTPDAILLDIKLPGISGLGILEMIKQMPHLRHIPVHMISALEHQRNALRMGALGYLTKPVTMEKVRSALSRIENLLSKQLRRVLLIEDDERQNDAISHLIAGADIEVIPAKTGKQAVEEMKKEGFDCIILDLTLPDVSGFDLLAELSSLDISLPPIVIYTGKDLSETEEAYLRRYSESIIIKGARSPERLLDEVNLFLHRVESLLPEEKRLMLSTLRSQDRALEGKTVLVVDDDIRNIFALTSALEAKGLHIRVARNGLEALAALDEFKDIDLVLMDIMMPKMDGFEAMRRIRSDADLKIRSIPIVALTAKAMKEDHEKCMDAGASDYIPKPINLDNLTTILKVWLAPKGILS
ncbi:response regulator [soil metagenome]